MPSPHPQCKLQFFLLRVRLLENHKNAGHFNQILCHAIASGLFVQNSFVSSKLILLSRHLYPDHLSFSRSLFFQIPHPNIFAWNFMFKAYSHSSSPHDCISLYNLMRRSSSILPDNYSFPFLLKASSRCSFSHKGQELHSLSLQLGFQADVFVQNALISMYAHCGLLPAARTVFDTLPVWVRDVVSWNSMISAYLQNDHIEEALKVLEKMLRNGVSRPDEVSLVSALTASARTGFLDLGMKTHGLLTANGFDLDVFLGSSLIDMYVKCGQMENARKVFDRIPLKNVVCWTCLINGYVQSDSFKEAIQMFRAMQADGVMPDAATAACVISACGHSGALDHGRWVHNFCKRRGIVSSLSLKNALIDMYSKCGDIPVALQIFYDLTERDVFSWTAMIAGLALNGESQKALHLFSQMQVTSDVAPNEVTFLGVLCACCHGGFVEMGFHFFKAMTQTYKLSPRIEHYGCMVDLLGRANLLNEAEAFIMAMPVQPDVVIWRSLLFASQTDNNVKLAELSARKIEELNQGRSGAGVLLSNTYAYNSRWHDVNNMRRLMALEEIKKQPGCSVIEIDGLIHEFFAAENSHSQINFIYETILGIDRVVRYAGFCPVLLDMSYMI